MDTDFTALLGTIAGEQTTWDVGSMIRTGRAQWRGNDGNGHLISNIGPAFTMLIVEVYGPDDADFYFEDEDLFQEIANMP